MEVEPPHTAAARTGAAGGGAPSSGSAAQRRESLVQPAGGAAAGVLAPIAITWSSLVGGVVKGLTPDVDGGVVAKVLLLLCLIVATEVIQCWSLATTGHCGATFQDWVDVIGYILEIVWGIWLIGYLKDAHQPEIRQAYSTPSLVYHMLVGNSASMMRGVITTFVIGFFFKLHGFTMNQVGGMPFSTVVFLCAEAISYVVLWLCMVAVENSYAKIRFVSLVASFLMFLKLFDGIIVHMIYQFNQDKAVDAATAAALDATEATTDECTETFGTNEFISSRILSLGAIVTVRLTCFNFFSFKHKYPCLAYCKDTKDRVESLAFASAETVRAVTADAADEGQVGFGGAATAAASGQLSHKLSNRP